MPALGEMFSLVKGFERKQLPHIHTYGSNTTDMH